MEQKQILPEDIREDEKMVRIVDSRGNIFEKGWKKTLSDEDAIIFTVTKDGLRNYCEDIAVIAIIRGTKKID